MVEFKKVRVTTPHIDKIEEFIKSIKPRRYAHVVHKSGQPRQHIHFYLEIECTQQTLREKLKHYFASESFTEGNKFFGTRKVDELAVEYLGYFFKKEAGAGEPKFHNIPADTLDQAKKYDEKVKLEIKKRKQGVQKSIFEAMNLSLITNYQPQITQMQNECARQILEWYRNNDRLIRRSYVVSLVDTYLYKHFIPYRRHMVSQLFKFG